MFNKIKSFFSMKAKPKVPDFEESGSKVFDAITEVKMNQFYTRTQKRSLIDGKVISEISLKMNEMNIENFTVPESFKIFNMFLEKDNFKMLDEMIQNKSVFSDEHVFILLKKMHSVDLLKKNSSMYNVVFSSQENKDLGFVYLKYLMFKLEKSLTRLELVSFSRHERGIFVPMEKTKLTQEQDNAIFQVLSDWGGFLSVASQICPVFLDHLESLDELNKIINELKKFLDSFPPAIMNSANLFVVGKLVVEKATLLVDDCMEMALMLKKINTESSAKVCGINSNVKEFTAVLEKYNILSLPCDFLNEECNILLIAIHKNLNHVSEEYMKADLSHEIPKMFDDVLENTFKSYFAMPENFRTTMYNSNGKSVQQMLENVLNTINERLMVVAINSHQGNLHEVSVMNQLTKDKWAVD